MQKYTAILLILGISSLAAENNSQIPRNFSESKVEFTENQGQIVDMAGNLRSDILFTADVRGLGVYLRKTGISYVIEEMQNEELGIQNNLSSNMLLHRTDVEFLNANPNVVIQKEQAGKSSQNFYLPNCPNGITEVKSYNKIVYQNIYPNIDIIFSGGKTDGLEYDIIVKPGGNPDNIKLKYIGSDEIEIKNEELRIKNSVGELIETIPKVYQNIEGKVVDVKAEYILNGTTLNFKLGTLNPMYSLVIDPWVTYYSGNSTDDAHGIDTDNNGDVIISGYTSSTNFPVTAGAYQTLKSGGQDFFVVKFDKDGNRLWATHYGGSGNESGGKIACDPAGNIFLTGSTTSNNFPVTAGVCQTNFAGSKDITVVKFNSLGSRLWATYFGGSEADDGWNIDTDAGGLPVITGHTYSNNFPVSSSAFQTIHYPGFPDAFCFKMDASGNLIWSTLYGGTTKDVGSGVIVDQLSGDVIISGNTDSQDFPVSSGAYITTYKGGTYDCFVVKFDNAGSRLWATYYGGNNDDAIYSPDVALDNTGSIIITGMTYSPDFPITQGAFQTLMRGIGDAFLAKLDPAGFPVWSTLVGGTNVEEVAAITVNLANNEVMIFGDTYSNDFPVTYCVFQTIFKGGPIAGVEDNFFSRFDSFGNLLCASYLGGTGHDEGHGGDIAFNFPYIYMTGVTPSSGYPVTPNAYQSTTSSGPPKTIIAQLCVNTCGLNNPSINFSADKVNVCAGETINYTSLISACDMSSVAWKWSFPGSTNPVSTFANPIALTYSLSGTYPVKLVVTTLCGLDSLVQNNYITVHAMPLADISGNTELCNGSSVVLSAGGGASYLWNTGETTNGITVFPTSSSTYTLIAYSTICTDTAFHTVTVNPVPVAAITGNTVMCSGDNVNLAALGGTFYIWNTGTTTALLTTTLTANISYTVIVSNGSCYDTSTVNIIVNPLPSAIINGTMSICEGNSTFLSASGGGNYIWNIGGTASTIYVTPSYSTIYTLTVTDANGCSNVALATVTVYPLPVLGVTSNTLICNGDVAILSANGGNTYVWSTGEVTNPVQVSPTTTTSYTLSGISSENCVSATQINIVVVQPPALTTSNDTIICQGQNAILSGQGGSNYLWNTGSSSGSISITPNSNATYTLTAFNGPCVVSAVINVTVLPALVAETSNNITIIAGSSTTLSGSGTGDYQWAPAAGLSCITCLNPVASPTQTTTYCLTITDSEGCSDSACVTVHVDFFCGDIFIPTAFSPNNDGQNDIFYINGSCIKTMAFVIYNRWGEEVFKTDNINVIWDGKFNEKILETDVFVYSLKAILINEEEVITKGNISLIR